MLSNGFLDLELGETTRSIAIVWRKGLHQRLVGYFQPNPKPYS
jgi:hypothetical protein